MKQTRSNLTLKFKGKTFSIDGVAIMGVLNITPDSFSDGGKYFENIKKAVDRTRQMLKEGADIIDVGGESTRPGARPVSAETESERIIPVISALRKKLGKQFIISVDTYKSEVARAALDAGADMVNDVSALTMDPEIASVLAEKGCPVILNHMLGTPRTMQEGEIKYNDVIEDIVSALKKQIHFAKEKGIKEDQIIIDPGFGFGKRLEHNIEILNRLEELTYLGFPVAIGVSRKSSLGETLKEKLQLDTLPLPDERLEASLAATAIAVLNGVNIIRTHDVAETKRFVVVIEKFVSAKN